MSFEKQVKDEMRDAMVSMPNDIDVWTRFESRARRYRARRAAGGMLVAAAFVAVVAITVPQIWSDPESDGFARPDASGEPTATAAPPEDGTHFVDRFARYELTIPAGWRSSEDPGRISAFAPEGVGEIGGRLMPPAAFSVTVLPVEASFPLELDRIAKSYEEHDQLGAQTTRRSMTIAGRPAEVFGVVYPKTMDERSGSDDGWCPDCRVNDYVIYWSHGYTMRVQVVARSQEANERWLPDGLRIVESLKVFEVSDPDFNPDHGVIESGVPADEATEDLARFLDARIEREGAEFWLSREAKMRADRGEFLLYTPTSNPRYASYRILSRESADANSYEYRVQMTQNYTDEPSLTTIETIGVGPGENHEGRALPNVIRFVRD